ncbi:MAG TPA: A/G-specific adenine glycosylase [Chitinophagaceae bacterium]
MEVAWIIKSMPEKKFSTTLLSWNLIDNKRQMPWKGETDPYKIWLSEIILQQTRVEQGLKYYERFISAFPTIKHLANAKDEQVYKLWEGLGYYSRCKNLLLTARIIEQDYMGVFPDSYSQILSLKGIGPYTAAAISSFAFNLPFAVVDGNVFRVLARIFGISVPVDTQSGKELFAGLASRLLDKKMPGIYNQAIMDFGALICKPLNPRCEVCPFKNNCIAFNKNKINALPVKSKKAVIKKRWFSYFIIRYNGLVAIEKRTKKDIWQNLNQFYLIETKTALNKKQLVHEFKKQPCLKEAAFTIENISGLFEQKLTHQLICGRFVEVYCQVKPSLPKTMKWANNSEVNQLAFPSFINKYLQQRIAKTQPQL